MNLHDLEIAQHLTAAKDLLTSTACQLPPDQAPVYDLVALLIEAGQGLLVGLVTGAVAESIRRLQTELAAAQQAVPAQPPLRVASA